MSIYPPETPTPRAAEHQLSIGRFATTRPRIVIDTSRPSIQYHHPRRGFWSRAGDLLHARGCGGAALVRSQSRDCVRHRLVGHWARYALDAAAREMADRRRGLARSSHPVGLGVAGFGYLASNWIRRPRICRRHLYLNGLPALFASSSATRGFGGST